MLSTYSKVHDNLAAKQEFIESAKAGKVLVYKCKNCNKINLATVYYCEKCGKKDFEKIQVDGTGSVVTYTIITVSPEGYEKYTPYAWSVIKLDELDLRISGFLSNISTPADLPLGTQLRIVGYDERGIVFEKQ